jgi:hypothetical protein
MKMKTFKKYLFMLAAALVIVSCSEDDSTGGKRDGEIASQNDADLVVDDLQGTITGDITLAADEDWLITGPLVVAAGGKLTIEAGTTIHVVAGGTNTFLAVERDGDIEAIGTAAEPITFTSNAAVPEAGDWGGIMIMGKATITHAVANTGATAVTEVVDYIYGAQPKVDNDNSGTLSYVIIEYTGARINEEKEFNGLTLYAVGSGTTISNIFINNGDDDGIEFFGGTVNVSNILIVNAKDDMFDWTQGYSGTATNIYGLRELGYDAVTSDPRGLEGDGNLDGLTPTLGFQSNPTINNLTIVNNSTFATAMNDVVKLRRGTSATITNAHVILGTGVPAPGDFVDFKDGNGDAATACTVNISGAGTNINTADVVYQNTNPSTVTVPGVANTGCATSVFNWTGYF